MAKPNARGLNSREKIIVAGSEMFGENPGTQLSVRAVAARAGVSAGSLRYHFPTQQALHETVLSHVYSVIAPDDSIDDRSIPARDRLVACLRTVIGHAPPGEPAREAFRTVYASFIDGGTTADAHAAYRALAREGERRVEHWLAVLTQEGALAEGDNPRRARFLCTVLNGLALERALPADLSILETETDTLYLAVDSLMSEA